MEKNQQFTTYTIQKIIDAYKVYYKYMNFSFIKRYIMFFCYQLIL